MMKTLFLAWQDQEKTRRWFVIGMLDRLNSNYKFRYVNQARLASDFGFQPLLDFPEIEKVYVSQQLFPLFENRLLSKSRPDYDDFLKRIAIENTNNDVDPMEILARTEGLRATDSFEVFQKPEPDDNRNYHIVFFARGVRHLPEGVEGLIASLNIGEELEVKFDLENEYDCNALILRSNGLQVGWIPRYLCPDIKRLKNEYDNGVQIRVELVNLPPAPVHQRLMCSVTAPWPEWEPFSDEDFLAITKQ